MNDILGYVTFKRTYARKIDDEDRTESFDETIDRIFDGCRNQLNIKFTEQQEDRLRFFFKSKKCSVAGRFLWQLGTQTVDEKGLLSLQNCAFVNIKDPVKDYCNMFNMLMLGVGVGFRFTDDVTQDVGCIKQASITHSRAKDADFIVPDSRHGWVRLLKKILKAYFVTGRTFTYSTILIREKGVPIKTFGGISSGHDVLVNGISDICTILDASVGKKPTQLMLLDIGNIIGRIVISGNVRRSALLALGDPDGAYINAKRWDKYDIPNWRAYSNNSIICNDIEDLPDEFWEGFEGNGECYGLLNIALMQKCGRVGETQYPDEHVSGTNPCGEQTLHPNETCCLAEVFLPHIDTFEEFEECVKFLYIINKHSLLLPCEIKECEEIIHKNMRMGISISGYLQSTAEQKSWLAPMYEELRRFDAEYSAQHQINTSIKLTTIKPSGTLSLVNGLVCPGIHPAYSKYYIRRVRFAAESPIVGVLKRINLKWEYVQQYDGTHDVSTIVVEFPIATPDNAVLAKDVNAIQQLEYVKELQRIWSDNAISVTVYYKRDEIDSIREWLRKNYKEHIKSVSFLLHNDHGFKQAPLEEISYDQYENIMKKLNKDVNIEDMNKFFEHQDDELQLQTEIECKTGVCPIR
jgi:hypothetical protein